MLGLSVEAFEVFGSHAGLVRELVFARASGEKCCDGFGEHEAICDFRWECAHAEQERLDGIDDERAARVLAAMLANHRASIFGRAA